MLKSDKDIFTIRLTHKKISSQQDGFTGRYPYSHIGSQEDIRTTRIVHKNISSIPDWFTRRCTQADIQVRYTGNQIGSQEDILTTRLLHRMISTQSNWFTWRYPHNQICSLKDILTVSLVHNKISLQPDLLKVGLDQLSVKIIHVTSISRVKKLRDALQGWWGANQLQSFENILFQVSFVSVL